MSDDLAPDAQPPRDHAVSSTDMTLDSFVAAARAWHEGSTTRQARGAGARTGVTALISGSSPRERRRAAESVAEATGSTLIRVDLARVVSKNIGETEKNMDALLDRARTSGFVLLFDEADALFGKRTDVKDAHDRYANLEVAYLIQRLESFEGLAILASNRRENIDPAFVRRLRYVVQLPE